MHILGFDIFRRRQGLQVERDKSGNWSYMMPLNLFDGMEGKKYLDWSLSNPVLFAVCAAKAKLYSQMEITAVNDKGEVQENVPEVNLLYNPNYFQSKVDFFYQQSWFLSATGNDLIYQIRPYSQDLPRAIYNLIPSEINYKDVLKVNKFFSSNSDITEYEKQQIVYKLDTQEWKLKIRDIIPLYDVASGLTSNTMMKSPSRVQAAAKNLMNIEENLAATNMNLQMSQKFLARNKTNVQGVGMLHDEDKAAIENVIRSKSLQITKNDIDVQHLVSDLKRLYLSEQFAHDAGVVNNVFEIGKDVITYALTGSTFENQETGIVRYIQTAIQSDADNTMNSLTNSWGLRKRGLRLKASYNHLSIMQSLVNTRIDTFNKFQEGLSKAIENQTISAEEAKMMSDKLIKELGL